MNKEFVQNLISSGAAALSSMAQAAKTTGEHLYSVLIRQQFVEGIGAIVSILIFIIFSIIDIKFFIRWYKKEIKADKYSDLAVGIIFMGIFSILAIGLLSGLFQTAIQKMINPEFYALKFIFESIKK